MKSPFFIIIGSKTMVTLADIVVAESCSAIEGVKGR